MLTLAFDVCPLRNPENVGIEVKNTDINAVKPTMADGLERRSMRDKAITRGCGSGEHEF